jgi:NAD(P) transhydrogenase beta subunit
VNVLLAEADVTNPDARNKANSPIYGMPILNVDESTSVIVLKRSMSSGYAGIDNPLFVNPKTSMLFGDARGSVFDILTSSRPFSCNSDRRDGDAMTATVTKSTASGLEPRCQASEPTLI